MSRAPTRRSLVAGAAAFGALGYPVAAAQAAADLQAAMKPVLDYAQGQGTTGFLVVQDGKTLVEANWPAPPDPRFRRAFAYETTADGALLEDVASQQKSFVSVLLAIAQDRRLLSAERPVSDYLGRGWSKATAEQEARIRVVDVLTMSSGLTTDFTYAAPPGRVFLYNTPVYAVTKRILAAAAGRSLEDVTRDWLTAPAGMNETSWRKRPAALGEVGNPSGLVTSPRDTARLGRMVLDKGRAADGRTVVSEAALRTMFARSAANPSYGRLWWLNGGAYAIKPLANRVEGPLIPAAPADLVAALGALDRKLYVVPSRRLVVVRMGAAAPDKDFDQQLWLRLTTALG